MSTLDISTTGHFSKFACPLRRVVVKGLASAVVAAAAGGRDRQIELQLVEALATLVGGASDVAVGDAVADANDHVRNVMRIVRIGKRIKKSTRRWG